MSPDRDPLELELESFPPPELPGALRARIGRAIDAKRKADRAGAQGVWPVRWMLAGALAAAACVAVSFAWFHDARPGSMVKAHPAVEPDTTIVRQREPGHQFATLAAYTRAAAGSPDRLDSLLNADAELSLTPDSRETRAFGSSLDDLKP
ncbi:MAG TPA: hypothetical protein VG269_22805 [Tepidisphaeraceae bacterium]|jgi:hypothetical protein|nr:hypothetical protein [Tepidisphaeraceae bacterium]